LLLELRSRFGFTQFHQKKNTKKCFTQFDNKKKVKRLEKQTTSRQTIGKGKESTQ